MASPSPSAPVTEPEVRGPDAVQEPKPETNGHLPSESKSDEPSAAVVEIVEVTKPLVNGNGDDNADNASIAKVESEDVKTEAPTSGSADSEAPTQTETEEQAQPSEATKPSEVVETTLKTEDEVMKDASQPEASPSASAAVANASSEKLVETIEKAPEEATEANIEINADATSASAPDRPACSVAEKSPEAEKDVAMGGTASETAEDSVLPTSEVDLGPAGMSQLAIDSTEITTSPTAPAADVSVGDLPAKITHDRDEDVADEPAPKRARTEPKEDEVTAPVASADAMDTAPTESAPLDSIEALPMTAALEVPSLSNLKWEDAEKDKAPISSYQRREIRKSLAKAKKTKSGGHFRDSVQKLWPQLWDTYLTRIERPMDLGQIDRDLRDTEGPYSTFGDVRKDLGLIFTNTLAFNGPTHEVTAAALNAVKTVWNEIKTIPAEEPVKPKSYPKAKPVREPRSVATPITDAGRRQSAGPGSANAAMPQSQHAQKPAANPRRESLADADRPKRTVRAPKSKEIDYTSKSRKKLKPELQFCDEVLAELTSPKHFAINQFFLEPVDPVALQIPQYYSVIKKPMDFGQVSRMLHNGDISSVKEFEKNVRLIFDNCFQFNGPPDQGNPVSQFAQQLKDLYESQMRQKDSWLAKHAKANAPASNASDDEDDEDDEPDQESAAQIADMLSNIRGLEAKMREESSKLDDLYLTDSPDNMMIQVQQGIVNVVRQTLVDKKTKLAELRAKGEKAGKKSKSGKTKSKKAAAPVAAAKKAGGAKKSGKKNLTAADKDQIANAINDLEGKHLDRAIDIIKNDTGQNENPEGELELDIDQLSSAALLKLWELCKKVLPGFAKDASAAAGPADDVGGKHSNKNAAAKGKKNKPMSAQEQEARIAQLEALSSMYKRPSEGADVEVTQAPTPTNESSDESSSEEE